MSLLNLAYINDLDFYGSYGCVINSGLDDLFKYPKLKEASISYSWPDQNGTDVDLTKKVFEARQISLTVTMMAKTAESYWTMHKALFDVFAQDGTFRFYIPAYGRSFFLYYSDGTEAKKLTKIKLGNQSRVACRHVWTLIEPVPSFWKQFTFLTDKNNDYIVTKDGYKILITT